MFTGIIEEIGAIKSVISGRMTVSASVVLEGTKLGDSIAINGICLTVNALTAGTFSVDIMPETLRRTNLGMLRPGARVNLERALLVGGRLGGHFVQGHIDATGKLVSLVPEGDAVIARYNAPSQVMRYVVEKGFIAVDGASVTVVACDDTSFSISLVAFTLEHTTLGRKRSGDAVNLEVDIISKYVEQLEKKGKGITLDSLAEHGFLSFS